uniref:Uncharacterized protein n=1 Tax=Candidatus Kentrum sp. FW TaxID=2126338 RepID=A0A450U1Q3_9GAMM|nr:MAG: Protein of unknown function (DUF2283) [Candidatus Kentron sp. FW]
MWPEDTTLLFAVLVVAMVEDEEIDALYLELGAQEPSGVIEIADGVNIDTTDTGKLTGIEILDASKKIDMATLLTYTLEFDQGVSGMDFQNSRGKRRSRTDPSDGWISRAIARGV